MLPSGGTRYKWTGFVVILPIVHLLETMEILPVPCMSSTQVI